MPVVAIVHITETWEMHKFNDAKSLLKWWACQDKKYGSYYTVKCNSPTHPDAKKVDLSQDVYRFGKRWCPWCATGRKFEYSEKHAIHRCSICHVSENEYWVRHTNGEN